MTTETARKAWQTRRRNTSNSPAIETTEDSTQKDVKKFKRELGDAKELCRILLVRLENLERRLQM